MEADEDDVEGSVFRWSRFLCMRLGGREDGSLARHHWFEIGMGDW